MNIPMAIPPSLIPTAAVAPDSFNDLDKKTQNLLLNTDQKSEEKRWRQTKTSYLKKLESDHSQLKDLIVEIQQQLSALKAQNDIMRDQLTYFQSCLTQVAPHVIQQATKGAETPVAK